jgi:hypothetical protein
MNLSLTILTLACFNSLLFHYTAAILSSINQKLETRFTGSPNTNAEHAACTLRDSAQKLLLPADSSAHLLRRRMFPSLRARSQQTLNSRTIRSGKPAAELERDNHNASSCPSSRENIYKFILAKGALSKFLVISLSFLKQIR